MHSELPELRTTLDADRFASQFLDMHQPVRLGADAMAWFAPVACRWHDYSYLKAKVGEGVHVDVACTATSSLSSTLKDGKEAAEARVGPAVFSGDENCRQDVQLQFGSLCDLALAAEAGTKHFAMKLGLEYYLCQVRHAQQETRYNLQQAS
jgi:hypothetical protein